MPFFLRSEDLGAATLNQRLFAESWLNLLESKVPMSIGPQPFSVLSLLESIRVFLTAGRASNVSAPVRTAIELIEARAWLKSSYPDVDALLRTLIAVAEKSTSRRVQEGIAAIDQLFYFIADRRVSSHVDFILSPEHHQTLVAAELEDLIADLIAIGHSESFLYGWGRGVLLPRTPKVELPAIADRLDQFRLLGRLRKFIVLFKVRRIGFLPHSDVLVFGKGVGRKEFKKTELLHFDPGETGAMARIEAPDYKAAIEKAINCFRAYREALAYEKKTQRLDLTSDEFVVRCEDDDTEISVPADAVRSYEPPALINGNAVWLCKTQSSSVAKTLEQVLYWLGSSRRVTGESEFICLWLALVSLFQSERVDYIASVVARCRLALMIQLLARWIADYLSKSYQLSKGGLAPADASRLRLGSPLHERLALVIADAADKNGALHRLGTLSPFLLQRVQLLHALCDKNQRDWIVRRLELELHVLLPWAKTIRNGVAHLGSTSFTGLDLINHHLREYVTLCYDQLAASAIQNSLLSVADIHAETIRDFDAIVEKVLMEPCVSVLHVRQGLRHTTALPSKFWAM